MNRLLRLCSVLPLILGVSLTACASGRAHKNFKSLMQRQVGKSEGEPNQPMNYLPSRGQVIVLSNGNIEKEYRFLPSCTVYFEVEKLSRKIVGWRYEGTEEACVQVP